MNAFDSFTQKFLYLFDAMVVNKKPSLAQSDFIGAKKQFLGGTTVNCRAVDGFVPRDNPKLPSHSSRGSGNDQWRLIPY